MQSRTLSVRLDSLAQEDVTDRSRTEIEGAHSMLAHRQAESDRLKSSSVQSSAELYSTEETIVKLEEQLAVMQDKANVIWLAQDRHNAWSRIDADPQIEGSDLNSDETICATRNTVRNLSKCTTQWMIRTLFFDATRAKDVS